MREDSPGRGGESGNDEYPVREMRSPPPPPPRTTPREGEAARTEGEEIPLDPGEKIQLLWRWSTQKKVGS